ncbi:MAG: bifunctional folylpolyglutamate synthase/dihydrofolate synthase [Bacteroidetes bacterium]|nr:bifunctional folylpolyglutamate synthase/dihydrofolate synthase [Bacteroidota bacterium]
MTAQKRNQYQDNLEYLYSLQYFGIKLGLNNIQKLLRAVGNPHKTFPAIHIAGTNGKGSTSSMIAAVLTAAGYKTGLYTSPHLVKFNERIRVNGKMISDKEIIYYTKMMRSFFEHYHATFFEATTAIMFKYFAEKKVEIAVIETGMGGRLDSTNIIRPLVSVITTIGKDHTKHLGGTLEKIAFEKAGIIKSRTPIIIGDISKRPKNVIANVAANKKSPVIESRVFPLPEYISLELHGNYQQDNARCAYAAIQTIQKKFPVRKSALQNGFAKTSRYSGLHGRFEQISSNPRILIDVAHNPDAIALLCETLRREKYKTLYIVFGVMKDKDYVSMLRLLKTVQPVMIVSAPNYERALSTDALKKECRTLKLKTIPAETIQQGVLTAKRAAGKKDLIVITGSHYVVGEALEAMQF